MFANLLSSFFWIVEISLKTQRWNKVIPKFPLAFLPEGNFYHVYDSFTIAFSLSKLYDAPTPMYFPSLLIFLLTV